MIDELDLGEGPAEEECAKYGDLDYARNARTECRAFIEAIRKVCGREPEGARLTVKANPKSGDPYYSVVCKFDSENEAAIEYAFRVERECPGTWEEAGMQPPLQGKGRRM